jgi:phosphoribosylanthranilate isomerase
MLSGPNLAALREMLAATPHPVVASGGVATATDIEQVATTGCAGCIVGRALYEGAVTIPAALAAAGDIA